MPQPLRSGRLLLAAAALGSSADRRGQLMHMSSQPSIYSDSDDDEEVDSEAGITPRELSTFLRGLGSDPLGLLAATSEEAGADQTDVSGLNDGEIF